MKPTKAVTDAIEAARKEGRVTEGPPVRHSEFREAPMTEKESRQRIVLMMPWPPSVNNLFATVGETRVLSRVGREYRKSVAVIVCQAGFPRFGASGLAVSIEAFPPDRRVRDLDNLFKAPLDALQYAGVFNDDSQVQRITIERGKCVKGGLLRVAIERLLA